MLGVLLLLYSKHVSNSRPAPALWGTLLLTKHMCQVCSLVAFQGFERSARPDGAWSSGGWRGTGNSGRDYGSKGRKILGRERERERCQVRERRAEWRCQMSFWGFGGIPASSQLLSYFMSPMCFPTPPSNSLTPAGVRQFHSVLTLATWG